jgi:predicted acylesterase/phospholipase RssA/CRP-like cAMP-binding protein/CheY-like chemotaxis protein
MNDEVTTLRELNYILCVDDEQAVLNQLTTQLEEEFGNQCAVECAESAEEALSLMDDIEKEGGYIRLVITDQIMPGMPGDRFLELVNKKFPHTHKILLTGYAGLESAMYAINYAGLDKYIEKPWDRDEFLATIRHLLEQSIGKKPSQGGFWVRDAIQNISIFRDLSPEETDLIAEKLQLLKFPKDTVIFNIDDPGDCMYIIKSGEVKVIAGIGEDGEVLAYLGRGNCFGEMALLTGESRSASIVTQMDSELFVLTKQDFDYLLKNHPSIALTLSHVLSQRLRDLSIKKASRQNKIIWTLNALQGAHEKVVVVDIARKLIKETNGKVVVIDLDPSQTQIALILNLDRENTGARWIIENLDHVKADELTQILPEDSAGVKFFIPPSEYPVPLSAYIIQVLSVFKEYYNFVLVNFRADCELEASVVNTMEQANTILYLFDQSEADQSEAPDEKGYLSLPHIYQHFPDLMPKIEVVAIRESPYQPVSQTLYHFVERRHVHYLRMTGGSVRFLFSEERAAPTQQSAASIAQISRDVSRIARRLGNVSIGLVLGGGGARTYAHLGVLKVLEEENIPIDMIAGTSMGAFIGALYTQGKTIEEILDISRENWKKLNSPFSWTIPRVAFIKAKRLRQLVHNIFGDVLIEDLPIPFFCVAGDLVSGQEVVIGQGKLYEAILATGALPAFFAPVPINNMQLVDGGVVNNVPGDVLKKQGVDIVIAVDVTPEREVHLIPDRDVPQALHEGNLFRRLWQYGKRFKSRYGTILLPRIIMRVIAIEGLEITRNKSRYFDIHIKPNLEDFDLFDFGKLPQIVVIGEQAGRREIAKIRDTINALKR